MHKSPPPKQAVIEPKLICLTGLSGAGKTTLAHNLASRLNTLNSSTVVLDGDALRNGLNQDLGFTESDRIENVRRTAEVAKLMVEAGLTVIAALISPYASDRNKVRSLLGPSRYVEVFINTPLEVCIERDPKGLYKKALKGELENFTGINAPYEIPTNPHINLITDGQTPEDLVETVLSYLLRIK